MLKKSVFIGVIMVLLFSFFSPIISVQVVSTTKENAPNITQTTEESSIETTTPSSESSLSSEINANTATSEQTSHSITEDAGKS
ncbi:hypothetical protein IGI95_002639 [Enterococcus sp. DIV0784]